MIINILNKYIYTWKREDEDDEQGEEEEELEDASPESSTNNKPLTAGVGMMEAEEGTKLTVQGEPAPPCTAPWTGCTTPTKPTAATTRTAPSRTTEPATGAGDTGPR